MPTLNSLQVLLDEYVSDIRRLAAERDEARGVARLLLEDTTLLHDRQMTPAELDDLREAHPWLEEKTDD